MAKHGGKDKRIPEGFVEIPGYPKYFISREGQVWYSRWSRFMRQTLGSQGYLVLTLNGVTKRKQICLHRLLALTYLDNTLQHPEVNHIDGDKLNNDINNLEWCSYRHNNMEARRLGLIKRCPHKIDESIIKEIRYLIETNLYQPRSIARAYNVSFSTVYALAKGRVRNYIIGTKKPTRPLPPPDKIRPRP